MVLRELVLQLVVLLLLLWVVDGGVGRRLGASGGNMLRAKQIPDFLQQANTAGMRCTLLLQVRCYDDGRSVPVSSLSACTQW